MFGWCWTLLAKFSRIKYQMEAYFFLNSLKKTKRKKDKSKRDTVGKIKQTLFFFLKEKNLETFIDLKLLIWDILRRILFYFVKLEINIEELYASVYFNYLWVLEIYSIWNVGLSYISHYLWSINANALFFKKLSN